MVRAMVMGVMMYSSTLIRHYGEVYRWHSTSLGQELVGSERALVLCLVKTCGKAFGVVWVSNALEDKVLQQLQPRRI